MGVFDVFQIPYSALQREHEELIAAAVDAGAGTLIRGGAARGAPSEDKNWDRGPIGLAEGEGQRRWESSGVEDLLGDMTRLEFVLRFTLSHPGLSSTIVGTSSPAHLASNIAVAQRGHSGRPLRGGQEAPSAPGSPLTGNQPERGCGRPGVVTQYS